jgi:hypothetical protein
MEADMVRRIKLSVSAIANGNGRGMNASRLKISLTKNSLTPCNKRELIQYIMI